LEKWRAEEKERHKGLLAKKKKKSNVTEVN
jgi:hypothetical protein